jgi:hypothetical protein
VTPEFAKVIGLDDETRGKLAVEKRSRVSFDIEEVDGISKLTVVHEFLEPDTVMSSMVSQGWPRVIAALKTLLETGDELTPRAGD